jgi:hypothetical protein
MDFVYCCAAPWFIKVLFLFTLFISLSRTVRLLRGACPEHLEILRYAQNDRKRRALNDAQSFSRLLRITGQLRSE